MRKVQVISGAAAPTRGGPPSGLAAYQARYVSAVLFSTSSLCSSDTATAGSTAAAARGRPLAFAAASGTAHSPAVTLTHGHEGLEGQDEKNGSKAHLETHALL
jgi:hypothetical protein